MSLGDRPTTEIVLLILAVTIALTLLLTGAGIFILSLLQPERDQTVAVSALGNVIGAVLGAVLGYLAGRGQRGNR